MKKTNNSVNNTIEFRTGFSKRLQNCPEALKENIMKIFKSFISCPDDNNSFELLWEMTHSPEKALQNWNLEIGDADNAISMEMVSAMKNELRYQRALRHPDFMKADIPESCREAFKRLSSASDAIVAVKVFHTCQERCLCADESDMQRSLYLISCEEEKKFFGGIRSLHFGKSAATALKPYSKQIHNLLEALWTEELARRQSNVHTPFNLLLENYVASDDAEIPANTESLPEIIPNEEIAESTSNEEIPESIPMDQVKYKDVSAVNITANEDIFENFLGACQALEEAGYDPNEVIGKMDAIAKILEVSRILKS